MKANIFLTGLLALSLGVAIPEESIAQQSKKRKTTTQRKPVKARPAAVNGPVMTATPPAADPQVTMPLQPAPEKNPPRVRIVPAQPPGTMPQPPVPPKTEEQPPR